MEAHALTKEDEISITLAEVSSSALRLAEKLMRIGHQDDERLIKNSIPETIEEAKANLDTLIALQTMLNDVCATMPAATALLEKVYPPVRCAACWNTCVDVPEDGKCPTCGHSVWNFETPE